VPGELVYLLLITLLKIIYIDIDADNEGDDLLRLFKDSASGARNNDLRRTKPFFGLDEEDENGGKGKGKASAFTLCKYPFIIKKNKSMVEKKHNGMIFDKMFGEHPFSALNPEVCTSTITTTIR
jgi:hypothetical protein